MPSTGRVSGAGGPKHGPGRGLAYVGHLAFLVVFALVSWRLAIKFVERKLIL
jgi:hypothetical protein